MKMKNWQPVLPLIGLFLAGHLPAQKAPKAQQTSKKAPVEKALVESAPQKTCGGRVKLASIWTYLASLHDKNKDGKITPAEFTRGKKAFGNNDRNRGLGSCASKC